MQQLLTHLCSNYVGTQYSKIVTSLFLKPQTLESLVQNSEESYKHLVQKLKYLIKLNIIVFQKEKGKLFYSIQEKMVLFFQRAIKYYCYIEENCTKEESKILFFFLEVMSSNFETYVKKQDIRTEAIQRTKQIFAGLIKSGYLYEDQRAVDLQISLKIPDDSIEDKSPIIQFQKKDSEMKTKQVKTKRKKKQPLKIEKTSGPTQELKPSIQSVIFSKIQSKETYFCISFNFIHSKIKDELIAKRLKMKFSLNKPQKQLVQMINQEKYQFPFDFFNEPQSNPKTNLLKDIQTQLLQEYINLRYGKNSLLVYKTLVESQYISEKTLLKLTLLELKPLRAALNPLFVSGIAKSIELKIQRTNTLVFWVDVQTSRRQYLLFLTKTCINLDLVAKKLKDQMLKQENKSLRTPQFQQKLLKLQANLLQIDDCLILYNH